MSNSTSNNYNNNLMQCQDCKGHFPLYTLEGLLPAQFKDESSFDEALLCLKCRRKAFEFIKEPYPYQVAAYSDSIVGVTIIPRITGSEAKLQYGLDDSFLDLLPHVTARFVSSAGEICKIKMYEDREILERARWMFGRDVGVLNACRVLALLGERIEHPPVGAIRERRNFICQMFLKQDLFEAPELPSVRRSVEHRQGDLHQIANFMRSRLIEYAFQAEPPPPGVNEYIDPVNGARILPRISMFEAKAQYCMDPDDLINCRLIGANFVQAAGAPGIRAMYEERDVLLVARLKYGGDVGIVYARGWFAARGVQVEVPPAGVFRERRNRIREAFLTKGYYAAPELPFVRLYVQAGEGNLEGIVQNFAIGWFDR
ncbi:hypothetical protein K457DRAFT_23390 [Linnemannia elongata AG-77]|uniref:Uncharacterized protein n=1 Tax=Linnemannia elongata AG-77 TaxID=1314771 RepID=A0A197JJJ6_9FUNG|nr:hypothetical protein K457DRAFT_23390 [Linnemannia elongata AG-77]